MAVPPCYLRGTHIRTPDGERGIEDLKIGDLIVTLSGETKPIKWIGRRAHERPIAQNWSEAMLPIRVAQSALAPNSPHRDLFLSRYHCLYLDGVLIPVVDLLNNSTITRSTEDLPEIEYFHIKLERHNVIYAEGAACETLHGIQPGYWKNFGEYERLAEELGWSDESTFAPVLGYNGRRSMFKGYLRSAIAPIIDLRSKLEVARDDLTARAAETEVGQSPRL
jgi:hypothetical protein